MIERGTFRTAGAMTPAVFSFVSRHFLRDNAPGTQTVYGREMELSAK